MVRIIPHNFTFRTSRTVDGLAHIMRLRESASINPRQLVADFKARVLDGDGHSMVCSCSAERDDMSAWLEHAEHLGPKLDCERRLSRILLLAHEAGRRARIDIFVFGRRGILAVETLVRYLRRGLICYDAVYAVVRHCLDHVAAVAAPQFDLAV